MKRPPPRDDAAAAGSSRGGGRGGGGFNKGKAKWVGKKRNEQRLGGSGGALSLAAFANAKSRNTGYNPALIKKQKEFYRNAKLISKYKKSRKQQDQSNYPPRFPIREEEGDDAKDVPKPHDKTKKRTSQSLSVEYEKKRLEDEKAIDQIQCDNELKLIWKSKCLPKLKVFLWLMYYDRLNTKDLMIRKNWRVDGGQTCILCTSGEVETRDHLFFDCAFAAECWRLLGFRWGLQRPILDRLKHAKQSFRGPCFLEIFASAAWNIWKTRNNFIFQDIMPSLGSWRALFISDISLHQYRVKVSMVQPLLHWISDISH